MKKKLLTDQVSLVSTPVLKAFLGLGGYVGSTPQIDNILQVMQLKGMNIDRMSFNPQWIKGSNPYYQSYVKYFQSHTSSHYRIIVDRNHLYPPTEASAATARANWATVKSNIFSVLQAFPNTPRVAVELINEYVSSDFYSRMQTLVTEIRAAGYTNTIVVNKWSRPWAVIRDSLNRTYQGYHYYFNAGGWTASGAILDIKRALSMGIKIIDTESGADSREYSYFTTANVYQLSSFLSQSASLGVGNCVWMNQNLGNWPRCQSLGLKLPVVSSPL